MAIQYESGATVILDSHCLVGGGGGAMAKEGKGKKKKRKKKKNKIYLAKCTNARMPIWSQRYKTTVISFLLAFGLITA